MIVDNSKQERLPALSSALAERATAPPIFMVAKANFMNFKAYLLSHNINDIIDKFSFAEKEMNSKWGAHDDIVLKRNVQVPQPTARSLSSATYKL
jgi:hypothetical protein